MSAPDTNVQKQAKRHKPAMLGIIAAIALFFLAAMFFVGWDNPAPSDGELLPPEVTGTTD